MNLLKGFARLVSVVLLCGASSIVVGQAQSNAGRGANGSGYTSLDLSNLYTSINFPIISKDTSARTPFGYGLTLFPDVAPGVLGQAAPTLGMSFAHVGGISFTVTKTTNLCSLGGGLYASVPTFTNFGFVDGSGAYHAFGKKVSGTTTLACAGDNWQLTSGDNSLFSLSASVDSNYHMTYTVYGPDGTTYAANARAGGVSETAWAPSTTIPMSTILFDSNGYEQIVNSCSGWVCTSGTSTPSWNETVNGTTTDGNLTWLNLGFPTASVTDQDGNTTSVTVTNLVTLKNTLLQYPGQTGLNFGRDLTKATTLTYHDPAATSPLTVSIPAYQGSNGLPVPTAQVSMQYTDSTGTARTAYLNEAAMYPNIGMWVGYCTNAGQVIPQGPVLIGTNAAAGAEYPLFGGDQTGNLYAGTSFASPAIGNEYPTSIVTADGQTMSFTYELAAESKTGSTSVTNVAVTNNVATVKIGSGTVLTKTSPVTDLTWTSSQVGTLTFSGSNVWAVNDLLYYYGPSSTEYGTIGLQVTAVNGTTLSVQALSGYCDTTCPSETTGFISGPPGALSFSGVGTATWLNGQTTTGWQYLYTDVTGKTITFPIIHANYTATADTGTATAAAAITGRIASVTLPTGGVEKYTYFGGTAGTGVNCNDGSIAGLKRQTPDGYTTTFTHGPVAGINGTVTTVVDAQSNETVYQYNGLRLVDEQIFQGTPTTSIADPSFESGGLSDWYQVNQPQQETQTLAMPFTGFSQPGGSESWTTVGNPITSMSFCCDTTSFWAALSGFTVSGAFPPGYTLNGLVMTANVSSVAESSSSPITLEAEIGTDIKTCTITTSPTVCTIGSSTDPWTETASGFGATSVSLQAELSNWETQSLTLTNIGFTGYASTGGASWSVVSSATGISGPESGTYFATVTSTRQSALYSGTSTSATNYPAVPGDVIQYGGWLAVYGSTTAQEGFSCNFLNSSLAVISSCPNIGNGISTQSVWQYFQGNAVAPAGTAYVQYFVQLHGNGDHDTSNATLFVDNVSFIDLSQTGLLQRTLTCYSSTATGAQYLGGDATPCLSKPTIPITTAPAEIDTYVYVPGTAGLSAVATQYDTYGRPTDSKSYDYGATTLTIDKSTTYGTYTGSITTSASSSNCAAFSAFYILDKVCETHVTDSTGKMRQQSVFQYNTTLGAGAGDMLTQNDINPIDVNNRVSTFTYTKGNQSQVTWPDNTTTTVNYSLCNNTMPSSETHGSFSVSFTANCNTDLFLTTTDINGGVWTNTYDLMSRVATSKTPLTTSSFTDTLTYTYTPTTTNVKMTYNSGASVSEHLSTLDSSGRQSISQEAYTSTTFSSVQTKYSTIGLVNTETIPYAAAAGTAAPSGTKAYTYTFDAMGRKKSFTNPFGAQATITYSGRDAKIAAGNAAEQYETDSFGDILSVCEVNTLSGSASCGQDTAATGFLTTYTYNPIGGLTSIIRNANTANPQTISFVLDGWGRRTSVTTQEAGQVTETYDTTSGTCSSTSLDNIVMETDAKGNVACFTYDSNHRKLSITYPSGPDAATTPSKFFVYDTQTTFTCPTGSTSNRGHLVEAYTGSSSSKITDEGFCYNARGELTDVFEITPHSHQTYHTTLSYYEAGFPKTLAGIPSTPSITYELGYAYVTGVNAASGQNPVTAATSQPDGRTQSVTFGSGDSDTFTFDTYNRFTGVSSTVGANTVTNTIGWNGSGTMASLAVVDPLNSSNTQQCTFGWDALDRMSQHKCVNGSTDIWGQNFAYDISGNIKKTRMSGFPAGYIWSPTYTTNTNQYTGSPFAYDGNGQATNDSFNTYTWNSDGKVHSITNISSGKTVTYTYDALGIMVEEYNGTNYYQYVQSPIGQVATTTSTN